MVSNHLVARLRLNLVNKTTSVILVQDKKCIFVT